ncbi:MAG TPA: 2-polyprenyl-3-methyl-6-methoxy-1,4-benzoquinone monooxygenase [Gammaproteobacteria bacterium]|nr:2-polyprenyl-3-methyl-6-methoxy-1,4-benzoquinone monooxygenase [Gammaproteobacteria bacterium]
MNTARRLTPFDRLLAEFDRALHASFPAVAHAAARPNPAAQLATDDLKSDERRVSGRLMRVNHAGEVAAQALYRGQALTASSDMVRNGMAESAGEEIDHLAWCEDRLRELDSAASRLDPLWYAGSFAIGAVAGLAGDKFSLGFIAETERQVTAHLDGHLQRLPANDARSRAILEQMKTDEAHHGDKASRAGGGPMPAPVRALMRLTSKVMTETAYWI